MTKYHGGSKVRDHQGRYSEKPAERPCTLGQARLFYDGYLAAICRHQDLRPREVDRQLARPGKPNFDSAWREAVYARQLALYLANTNENVPQVLLAQVTGLTPAAVTQALQAIEDLRDHKNFDALIEIVAAEMAQPTAVEGARP